MGKDKKKCIADEILLISYIWDSIYCQKTKTP